MQRIFISAAVIIGLTGCGGGGSVERSVNFQQRANDAQLIYDQTSVMSVTLPQDMPMSSSATYSGVTSALLERPAGEFEAVYADVTMSADFGAATVSGEMSDWYGNTIGDMNGSVAITDGTITGEEWDANGIGTLLIEGVSGDVSVAMNGEFLGPSADGLQGTFAGTIDYPTTPAGNIAGAVDALQD